MIRPQGKTGLWAPSSGLKSSGIQPVAVLSLQPPFYYQIFKEIT